MPERRAGLHREISSIFNGVPIQQDNPAERSSGAPAPESPPAPPRGGSPNYGPPSHLTGTVPKPQQPVPKAAPARQTKAAAVVITPGPAPWQKMLDKVKSKLFSPKAGVSTTRQKTMAILIPALFIVLIFVLIQVFSTPSQKATGSVSFGPTGAVAGSDKKIEWQIPALWPTVLRDPMRFGSAATGEAGASGLIVKGILYSEDNPSAAIGTQIVREGDKVLGATVVKINEDSVEFERDGKSWTQKVQR